MTMVIDGSNGLTYPNSSTQASSSVVLQVVNATFTTQSSTTSSTYSDSGISISITPKFSTSKVLVAAHISGIFVNNSANFLQAQLVRNSTAITGDFSNVSGGYNGTGSNIGAGTISVSYLDSPATTSSTTYKVQVKSATNTQQVYWSNTNSTCTITVMEVAA